MVEYNIKITGNRAYKKLDKLKKRDIERKILNRIGEGVISYTQSQKLAGQVLKRQSGALANSMQKRLFGAHSIKVGPGMAYGAAHEFGIPLSAGMYIYPKRGKALAFEVGGKTILARRVRQHVIKRPYLAPAIQEYINKGKAKIVIDKTIQQELDAL